jgi:origin recognition complex subunit 4
MMTALDPPPITTPVLTSLPESDEDPHLTAVKAQVLSRLTNSVLVPLTNLATEYAKVHSLLKATVAAGEGNSILILGARGSGKTALVETALADVSHEHAQDFHIVRLNGFQQTDDKIALREIWRQLGREMQVEEDETSQVSSYADTMASLLHLLSHPEELAEVLDPDAPATTTKSIIFILDEFDLFATHPRQTLLYNLFDIAQAKKAPIAVIGCSTRVDVAESLEKRVKSRFSHRWIHLSQPKSIQAFEAVIEAALCLEVAEDDIMDDAENSWRIAWNRYMKVRTLLWEHVMLLTGTSPPSYRLRLSKLFSGRYSLLQSPSQPPSPRYTFRSPASPPLNLPPRRRHPLHH